MENTNNLVLEHLKALRNELRDTRRDLSQQLTNVTLRVGSLEQHTAGLRNDVTLVHGDMAIMHQRMDDMDGHIVRIEQRLELA